MRAIILSAALLLTGAALSQANTKWNMISDPYYGMPTFSNYYIHRATRDVTGMENKQVSGLGPTGLRTEFMVNNWLGLGADAMYNQAQATFDRTEIDGYVGGLPIYNVHHYELTLNRTRIQARINFHIPVKSKRLDWYGGLAFGSNAMKTTLKRDGQKTDNVDDVQPRFHYLSISARTSLGFRYYPTKFVGINFELGIGGPIFTTGVSTRFGFKLPSVPEQFKADGLKEKADQLQEKANQEQKKIEELKKEEKSGEKNIENIEKERQKLEEEKQQVEKEKLELERQQLELEKKQLEEERKKLEEEKKAAEEQGKP